MLLRTLCLALLPLAASAGRPFVTEDAGLLARGACEWESVASHLRSPGAPRATILSTQIGCGLRSDLQLALSASRARAGGDHASGLGLSGKWSLWNAGESSLTLAWGSSWNKLRGASHDWDGASAQAVFSQGLGEGWSAHAQLGRSYSRPDRRSTTNWASLVERQLSDSLDLGAELFGEGDQRPGLGIGARWRPAEGWSLDASLARTGSPSRERLLTLGFKREF